MATEADEILGRVIDYFQTTAWIRKVLMGLFIFALLTASLYYIYRIIPKNYVLTISGGEILGNRHYLAKLLQEESTKEGVTLIVSPNDGSLEALRQVSDHKLDLALIQGGIQKVPPNVYQLANLVPEVVHLVVKPKYNTLTDLKGAVVNVGDPNEGTRAIVTEIMRYSGLEENINYAPVGYSAEDLVSMAPSRLPDAMFIISLPPSYLVEFLVRERGYKMIEIPFPAALSIRNGWMAEVAVLPYTYGVNPPVPATTIKSIGVPMTLVTHDRANPAALVRALETLYSRQISNRLKTQLNDSIIANATAFPLSPAVNDYLSRNESILSKKTWDKGKEWFGAIMSFAGSGLFLLRWFQGRRFNPTDGRSDERLIELQAELAALVQVPDAEIPAALTRLNAIRLELSALPIWQRVDNKFLSELFMMSMSDTRTALLLRQTQLQTQTGGGTEPAAS